MANELRDLGIDVLGYLPWGAHLCIFYQTKRDLLGTLVPYFKTGLDNREFCLWVTADFLTVEQARNELRQAVPDLERHLAEQSMVITSSREWYPEGDTFDAKGAMSKWNVRLDQALARGYAGMRASGDKSRVRTPDWKAFCDYAQKLNTSTPDRRMIMLCTNPLLNCGAADFLDLTHTHQFGVTIRNGNWEVVETPEIKQAKVEMARQNVELRQKVLERTRELSAANERLRSLSSELTLTEDRERRRLATDLHDGVAQLLAVAKMKVHEVFSQSSAPHAEQSLQELSLILDDSISDVRQLMSGLAPPILAFEDLVSAVDWVADNVKSQYRVRIDIADDKEPKPVDEGIKAMIVSAIRELLMNAVKHGKAGKIKVILKRRDLYIQVTVRDDGSGFDVSRLGQNYDATGGFGLFSLRERLMFNGGSFRITSKIGRGTEATVIVPLTMRLVPR